MGTNPGTNYLDIVTRKNIIKSSKR